LRSGLTELQGGRVDAALIDLQVAVQCDPKLIEGYIANRGRRMNEKRDETEGPALLHARAWS